MIAADDHPYLPLGSRIAQARFSKGMRRDVLASMLGVGAEELGLFEEGVQRPSSDVLHRISDLLEVTTAWLVESQPAQTERFPMIGVTFRPPKDGPLRDFPPASYFHHPVQGCEIDPAAQMPIKPKRDMVETLPPGMLKEIGSRPDQVIFIIAQDEGRRCGIAAGTMAFIDISDRTPTPRSISLWSKSGDVAFSRLSPAFETDGSTLSSVTILDETHPEKTVTLSGSQLADFKILGRVRHLRTPI